MPSDYSSRSIRYAREVVSGRITVCRWVQKACRRHLDDLEHAKSSKSRWRFDVGKANRVCQFVELLPHVKGPLGGQPIRLEDWQCFVLCCVFGWVDRKSSLRRFRIVYIEVPRGNAKSTLSAAILLYMLAADGEEGAECYSAAKTREQAGIVFKIGRRMALKSDGYRAKFGVSVMAHSVVQEATGSNFSALSAEGSSLDGLNIHCAVVDELHAHKSRTVYDVLETGIGKRLQPLLWNITTAGSNQTGICYEIRSYCTQVLDGEVQDDNFFGTIYAVDEKDDWTKVSTWKKANPNWGVSVDPATIRQLAGKAKALPSAQSNFKTKHLDVWVTADKALYDVDAWDRCADPKLSQDKFKDAPCTIGLDLASRNDLAARVDVFEYQHEGKPHYAVFEHFYLPEEAVLESKNSQYQGWTVSGLIDVHQGPTTDYDRIEDEIVEDLEAIKVREVAYDPWQAAQLAGHLDLAGATVVEVRPTVANFSDATDYLGALMKEGRIHHTGSPVLRWMIGNVVGHYDNKDNVYPKKERPESKIDGAIALIMALSRCLRHLPEGPSKYETEDLVVI